MPSAAAALAVPAAPAHIPLPRNPRSTGTPCPRNSRKMGTPCPRNSPRTAPGHPAPEASLRFVGIPAFPRSPDGALYPCSCCACSC
ncbi:hypothetical protein EK904_014949 [Melospiza melodia maxima]|nr:hypothetical protein EK904_014949 [Melospiza melodia maxima]